MFYRSLTGVDNFTYDYVEIYRYEDYLVQDFKNCIFKNKNYDLIKLYFEDIDNIFIILNLRDKIKLKLVIDDDFNFTKVNEESLFLYKSLTKYENFQVYKYCNFNNENYDQIVIDTFDINKKCIKAEFTKIGNNYEKITNLNLKLIY
jgi:hypothetical protein